MGNVDRPNPETRIQAPALKLAQIEPVVAVRPWQAHSSRRTGAPPHRDPAGAGLPSSPAHKRSVALMLRTSSVATMSRRTLDRMTPTQVKLVLGLLAAAAALAFALVFAEFTESVWRGEDAVTLDEQVMRWVLAHRPEPLSDLIRIVTNLAGPVVVSAVVVGVVAISLRRGRPRVAVFMVASTAGAALMVATVKLIVARPRPGAAERLVSVTGASFPSGHSAQSVACWVALGVVLAWVLGMRWVSVAAVVLSGLVALVVGGSRVYLGVHWPSDVIAGWALGLAWVASLLAAFALWDAWSRRPSGDPQSAAGPGAGTQGRGRQSADGPVLPAGRERALRTE